MNFSVCQRYQTSAELRFDLERFAENQPIKYAATEDICEEQDGQDHPLALDPLDTHSEVDSGLGTETAQRPALIPEVSGLPAHTSASLSVPPAYSRGVSLLAAAVSAAVLLVIPVWSGAPWMAIFTLHLCTATAWGCGVPPMTVKRWLITA